MSFLKRESMKRFLAPFGLLTFLGAVPLVYAAVDAPAGMDDLTNGFESQTQFDLDRAQFENRDEIADGLGPIYNAQACSECHQSPLSGSVSQISEQRAGKFDGTTFTAHAGGSLINDRGIAPGLHEMVSATDNVRTFRASLNLLGDGFVEAIPDSEFTRIRNAQPPGMKGTIIYVPVLEAPGTARIGRFGWKNQHASLLSFSADAYLNETGITSPLQPNENTMNGQSLAAFDTVPDPEDAATPAHPFGPDVESFTRFMRSTKAPSSVTTSSQGFQVFVATGCDYCHTTTITTAPTGTQINGSTFTVPAALGDKNIHPFGDFMLHDIGTGDGIDQGGGPTTRNKVRTAPLWGLKNRSRLLHTAEALTIDEAILRHGNEALPVIQQYASLDPSSKNFLIQFLMSL
ncbi:MAG TPA: di-heme oxidoredictase family protein [Thermoanaerobaculia bacterium]|jgi:CxxC motif-containing protein (DUF1111 family)|nr:di-heme oxidoredictase family protein [Thermoanaerobaculia bacterium]